MDEFMVRANLVMLEVDRLAREAKTCTDPDRLDAIERQMAVLVASIEEIRREQLIALLPAPKTRRWWQLWRRP